MSLRNPNSVSSTSVPIIIGVGGFSSEVGKTTLLCELLRAFPGSEAIKTTRGHYRSCGKNPHECCVSDLLEAKAVVRSGRELTYSPGKDTGLYWDAGATNVHWVIATDSQVDQGFREALSRVNAAVVFVEGNSFTQTLSPHFFIMVAHPEKSSIKKTARTALSLTSAIYVSGELSDCSEIDLRDLVRQVANVELDLPLFTCPQIPTLVKKIQDVIGRRKQTRLRQAAS